jgi:predicted MPP superfamily phosphohydrolase
LKVSNWSAKLNGFKVIAISDFHGGSNNVTEEKLRKIVETANSQNPDLIVLLGDYVSQINGKNSDLKMPVEIVAKNLRGLKAKYGVYAIIGNHDWWYDEKKVSGEFERAGIKTLENQVESISVNDETVYVWGIEDYWKSRAVPTEAFDKIPNKQNVIAITHNPDSLLKSPAEISLMLAGHSHGGQVNFPFYGAIPFVNDPRFMAGNAEVDGKHVFITTGIGCTGPQIRFRVPPEIAVLNLFAEN